MTLHLVFLTNLLAVADSRLHFRKVKRHSHMMATYHKVKAFLEYFIPI